MNGGGSPKVIVTCGLPQSCGQCGAARECTRLADALRDARDQLELMEFRLLELEDATPEKVRALSPPAVPNPPPRFPLPSWFFVLPRTPRGVPGNCEDYTVCVKSASKNYCDFILFG